MAIVATTHIRNIATCRTRRSTCRSNPLFILFELRGKSLIGLHNNPLVFEEVQGSIVGPFVAFHYVGDHYRSTPRHPRKTVHIHVR